MVSAPVEKVQHELAVACCEVATVFQAAEVVLDQMPVVDTARAVAVVV